MSSQSLTTIIITTTATMRMEPVPRSGRLLVVNPPLTAQRHRLKKQRHSCSQRKEKRKL